MLLTSIDGASVELRISGYQFPGYQGTTRGDWDANWLNVRGNVAQADGKTWSFEDPSLTTWEALELGIWLQEAAAGAVPVSRPGTGKPGQRLVFTEPNLAFSLESRIGDQLRMGAHFRLEALPPWLRGEHPLDIFEYVVLVDLSAADLAGAARTWFRDLANYPER